MKGQEMSAADASTRPASGSLPAALLAAVASAQLLHWMRLCNADANSWPSRLRRQDGHCTSVSGSLMGLAVMQKGAPVFLPARPS